MWTSHRLTGSNVRVSNRPNRIHQVRNCSTTQSGIGTVRTCPALPFSRVTGHTARTSQ